MSIRRDSITSAAHDFTARNGPTPKAKLYGTKLPMVVCFPSDHYR